MAETKIASKIRAFKVINAVSIEDRAALFKTLSESLLGDEIDPNDMKAITKIIVSTLTKFNDPSSQSLVNSIILDLLKKNNDLALEHLQGAFKVLATKELSSVSPAIASKPAARVIFWTILVLKNVDQSSNIFQTEWRNLIRYQSLLYQIVIKSSDIGLSEYIKNLLLELWQNEDLLKKYMESLLEQDSTTESLLLLMLIFRLKTNNGTKNSEEQYKKNVLNQFVKCVITAKVQPDRSIIVASQQLLNAVEKGEFETILLPPLQRSILRSPEIILSTIGLILQSIHLELDSYVPQIGKALIQNLNSTDESTRKDSIEGLRELSKKCYKAQTIKNMLNDIFSILNGADGKITMVEYRVNLLQGAGSLSLNSVGKENIEEVLKTVVVLFSETLQNESQDKVLCCALDMLSMWSIHFVGNLPENVMNIFEKGLQLKTTSELVRLSYLQWLLETIREARLQNVSLIHPILVNVFFKGLQNCNQSILTSEAICAACILIKTSQPNIDNTLNNFWNTVLDVNKQFYLSERFLQNASVETVCHIALLTVTLLKDYFHQLKGPVNILFKLLVLCLLKSSSKIRKYMDFVTNNILHSPKGISLVKEMIVHLEALIEKDEVVVELSGSFDEERLTNAVVTEAIYKLCKFETIDSIEAQSLSLQCLILCHYPVIFEYESFMWEKILTNFNLDPKSVISVNIQQINEKLIQNFKMNKGYENAITTTIRICPEFVLPLLIERVKVTLSSHDILNVTDDEFLIYQTPNEELFDKSVIPNIEDVYSTLGLKRENKTYSYKDQLEEIQVRKEIEEKRRKEGKLKTPPLTAKQQEAIKNQIEKEKSIRKRLISLNDELQKACSILRSAYKGNAQQVSLYFCDILHVLLSALKSPLAAGPITELYQFMHSTCFGKNYTDVGSAIAKATLSLSSPRCDISELNCQDCVEKVVVKTLEELYETVNINLNQEKNLLNAPCFSCAFEFLKRASGAECVSVKEDLLLKVVQLIDDHAQLRGDTADGDFNDFKHPKFMPRHEIIKLLLEIITSYTGRVQVQAMTALSEISNMSSGQEFCAVPRRSEIELLLKALKNKSNATREASLRALNCMKQAVPRILEKNETLMHMMEGRIWIARYDFSMEIRALANNFWESLNLKLPYSDFLLDDISDSELCIQKAASAGLVPLIEQNNPLLKKILKKLLLLYNEKLSLIPPVVDQFEREVGPSIDQWESRRGVSIAIANLAKLFSVDEVNHVMQFMVSQGLGDRGEVVQKEMLAAALIIVDLHGQGTITTLLPVFEDFLDKAPKSQSYDNIRQSVVILMGSLARHLAKDDERIKPILRRLLSALSTPSEQVQEAVANCLPHLIPSMKDEAQGIVKKLMQTLVKSEKYGERRGAAYGLAGIVKGLGILSLKQLDIMSKLTNYIQEKKNYKFREGALFAFEILCTTLGRLFEPYIVHVLPHLLQCFGDASQYVRQAADDTAKVVMAKLSAHGVKLVLPALLDALDKDSWRTKTASVELLGAMAFCAPKQLSSCLPSIVPKLIEVLGDSHAKVQEAGAGALRVIGSVIKNPEIQAIVPVLLAALEDPSKNTSYCLNTLLKTKFVHFIDAPSLALIMPVVQRAFLDRSTETRKMAAQIIGNMYSLTDQKDLTPYLPQIMPGLKTSLLDPVPEVRAVSSRALGAMVRVMGESSFDDLLPWLMQTLTSEASSVDRSGAAQGLSEVVGSLGVEKLHKLMPEIILTAERCDIAPHVKDGYIMMFIYMPVAFPEEFMPYIGQIIKPILKALADESEYVRDTALKAGQRIINLYAETAVALLLPELEKGLFDDNWRIRYSSVQLLGDLLYRISGVSGKMTTETASEDDNFGTEKSHQAIIMLLGEERRNRVLSGLYMGRSDVSLIVRQAALHVWKVVVTNTPRTLKEILPTLFSLLLGCLASTSYDKRQVAARTLGDLVRKLGERVLPEIIPILESGLNSEQPDQRQGVCIGLSEIMTSTSKDMVLLFVKSLVPTVRKALSDPLPEVREAAAKTFESLHSTVGSRALDDILPDMLESLSHPDPDEVERTLDGLRQVVSIKPKVVLPYLVPQLTLPQSNTKALSILVSVAGDALTKYLPKILSALLETLSSAQGTPNESQELVYCQAVILSVTDDVGIRTIMDVLMSSSASKTLPTRKSAAILLSVFCIHSSADYLQYVPQLLRCFLRLMVDSDKDILQRSWDALNAVVKTLDSTQQIAHVADLRQAVRFAASDLKQSELPGFCLPKGVSPLLPVFREAILNGLPDEKESAAQGLGEIIALTNAQSLQPSVVHITGPLIRILGDRFNAGVKAAVLETLGILLHKVGVMLKQFLPQLQTTFLKALHDQSRLVRIKAARALSKLVTIHTRADPLFNEIHNNIKSIDDPIVKETMLHALRSIICPAGDKISEILKAQIYHTLITMLNSTDDTVRGTAAGCLGALLRYLNNEDIENILLKHIFEYSSEGVLEHSRSVVLYVGLKESPKVFLQPLYRDKVVDLLARITPSAKIGLSCNGVRGITYFLQHCIYQSIVIPHAILTTYSRAMNQPNNEVKQLVARSCHYLANVIDSEMFPTEVLRHLVPMLVNGTKEKNSYVRSNSELALLSILRLRQDELTYCKVRTVLEIGAQESLNEIVSKVLRKAVFQPTGKDEDLDETLLA